MANRAAPPLTSELSSADLARVVAYAPASADALLRAIADHGDLPALRRFVTPAAGARSALEHAPSSLELGQRLAHAIARHPVPAVRELVATVIARREAGAFDPASRSPILDGMLLAMAASVRDGDTIQALVQAGARVAWLAPVLGEVGRGERVRTPLAVALRAQNAPATAVLATPAHLVRGIGSDASLVVPGGSTTLSLACEQTYQVAQARSVVRSPLQLAARSSPECFLTVLASMRALDAAQRDSAPPGVRDHPLWLPPNIYRTSEADRERWLEQDGPMGVNSLQPALLEHFRSARDELPWDPVIVDALLRDTPLGARLKEPDVLDAIVSGGVLTLCAPLVAAAPAAFRDYGSGSHGGAFHLLASQKVAATTESPSFYRSCTESMARALIAAGCDINAACDGGTTPLHVAAQTSVEHVRVLLAHGADPDRKDNRGWTPSSCARDAPRRGRLEQAESDEILTLIRASKAHRKAASTLAHAAAQPAAGDVRA